MARSSLSPQMVTQILDHMRVQNMREGHHLPAQGLADTFRVSRAPIVSALKKLEEMGVVRSEANRGYFLLRDAANLPQADGESGSEDAVYFQIAEDRLSGKLPDRMSENELMRLYNLPRGRLVKILHLIADEGWIDRLPGNGWEFRETLTSRKAYADAYQFRAAIEMQALLLPSFSIDREAFAAARAHQQALLKSFESESRSSIFGTNVEFHEMLMTCANNDFFLDAVRRVNRVRRLMEYRITNDRSRLPQQCREHLEILDLIEARDMQAAATFLYRHVREAGNLKAALIK
ncbi:GntR family transcriptional regulator [Paracoccus sp. DMF-8]|uniref:GntR family transcriptional regulator n=1 Tax=Paracoccus sp. DMF-8 TaxID=3019445 RepID=UPI0023E8C52D|nr:GntR family transcriptional regulator [Paracoccus sp. DMF-8]MDF3606697.1 GntR family transcriptional regulator [Paracoccus sp. DMF-8]